jgi:hypothetical protein
MKAYFDIGHLWTHDEFFVVKFLVVAIVAVVVPVRRDTHAQP